MSKGRKGRVKPSALPSKGEIAKFVRESPTRVGRREIARAFNISGSARTELKRLLAEMRDEGMLGAPSRRARREAGQIPPVGVLEITDRDVDGELLASPIQWRGETAPPRILIVPGARPDTEGPRPVGVGDRVLARLAKVDGGYEARIIRQIGGGGARHILGVYQAAGTDGWVQPVEKGRDEISVAREQAMQARSGELVMVELEPRGTRYGPRRGKVCERLGSVSDARSISLIAIHEHGIPADFSDAAEREAEEAAAPSAEGRKDLRDIPFVTIDPPDARDRDDAVWAQADTDPRNAGGWVVMVAIADVAHFVRPGSALDREALKRGNSTYFPDRVVPMLPETLSNGLCSLHQDEDRACMAVRMTFDAGGRKLSHEFIRGLMCSRASLTYAQVQAAEDGHPDELTEPWKDTLIAPLFGAYRALAAARATRHPLELEVPERRILLDEEGHVQEVRFAEHLDAHQLIEEFMIAANVCAAETLEHHNVPCMYRIHEEPTMEKLEGLREFLDSMGYKLARGQLLTPEIFNRILDKAKDTDHAHVVNQVILRAQSQAKYSPDNVGHFGLALPRYAHFTSPIRRYADTLVHRALIRACKFGEGGLPADQDVPVFREIGEEISAHERRSMAAERDSADRYLAAFLADRVGAAFEGTISGVTRFGLFVSLTETGADGLIPIKTLGTEYFEHDEHLHALVGRNTGTTFRLGDHVSVHLIEAVPVTGGLRLELVSHEGASTEGAYGKGPRKRRRSGKPKAGKKRNKV